jgi:hypothetical protein
VYAQRDEGGECEDETDRESSVAMHVGAQHRAAAARLGRRAAIA